MSPFFRKNRDAPLSADGDGTAQNSVQPSDVMAGSDRPIPRNGIRPSLRAIFPPIPIAILLIMLVIPALFAEFIAPHDPFAGGLSRSLRPPFWEPGGSFEHILGSDRIGRDILSRIIFGARISSIVALLGVTISAFIGTSLGLIAGYYGGLVDAVVMRLVDMTLAFPAILLALALATAIGPTLIGVVIVVVFILWAFFARQVRGEVLSLMPEDFVAQARITGQGAGRIMVFHLLPNVAGSIIVLCTLQFGLVILLESTLSFLGVGLPRPTPAWGVMVADGRDLIVRAWWVAFFPGLALTITVLAANAWGDRLRDALDPRRQG